MGAGLRPGAKATGKYHRTLKLARQSPTLPKANGRRTDMAKAYSLDLRERVLAAVAEGLPLGEAAERFRVSVPSIVRWRALERGGRGIGPKPFAGGRRGPRQRGRRSWPSCAKTRNSPPKPCARCWRRAASFSATARSTGFSRTMASRGNMRAAGGNRMRAANPPAPELSPTTCGNGFLWRSRQEYPFQRRAGCSASIPSPSPAGAGGRVSRMERDRPPGPIIDRSGFSTPAPGAPMLNPGGLPMLAPEDGR